MKASSKIWVVPLALAGVIATSSRGEAVQDTTAAAAAAEFIFSGTVLRAHAATIELDDATDYAIVRVDRVLVAGRAFRPLVGRTITVRLRQADRVRDGERRVYFTKGWHWGEEIGVIELSSVTAPTTGPGMQRMQANIDRQRRDQSDRELAERLRTAELVVVGKVTAVRKSELRYPGTEHDPEWQEADITVERAHKGTAPERRVTILFPGTDDPMWYGSPRFRLGQDGIWLLHPLDFAGKRLPRLTALQRGDFRPRSDEARIRRLLPK